MVSAKLAQLRDTLATGLATMRDIAARASRHNAEIDFMVWIAAIKHHHADILLDVLAGRPVCSRKAALWGRLGLQGVEVLKPLVEPLNIWRLIDMWWKPLATTFTMAPIPRSPEA